MKANPRTLDHALRIGVRVAVLGFTGGPNGTR